MKTILQVIPAEFKGNMVSIKYPYEPLYRAEHTFTNLTEIQNMLKNMVTIYKQRGDSAKIFIKTLDRKLRGFDKWCQANPELFYIDQNEGKE